METDRFLRHMVMVAVLVLMAWLLALPAQAADQASGEAIASASTGELGVVSAGSVEDTLKACLARIPKEASAGQRMMAEQSCDRDEDARKAIQVVPGF